MNLRDLTERRVSAHTSFRAASAEASRFSLDRGGVFVIVNKRRVGIFKIG